MSQQNLMLLFVGAVLVGLIAVVIDRLNFPQKRFRPKTVRPTDRGPQRDRTGAHITQFVPDSDSSTGTSTGPGDNPSPQEQLDQ